VLTVVPCAVGRATVDDVNLVEKNRERKHTRFGFGEGFFCGRSSGSKGSKEKGWRSKEMDVCMVQV
jgi:hypothetical protein